jgi:CDP-diacylglycerol--glycerol-3-phosphate 3-phosphatidyltransferase
VTAPLPPSTPGYGPSALVTPANGVTVARLLLAPLLVVRITAYGADWWNLALWMVLASTDGIDGWVARRHGTTRSGAFLDPLADKVLVLGALFSLVAVGSFWWVPVAIIAVREFAVSLWRVRYARRGLAVPADRWGKAKTAVQGLAIAAALTPPLGNYPEVATTLLWVAVVASVASGFGYARRGAQAATPLGDPPAGTAGGR